MQQLQHFIDQHQLPATKSQALQAQFAAVLTTVEEWKEKINSIVITDVSQKNEMRQAGEARKFLKAKRVEVEKTRKALKEESLREGKSIDAIARFITEMIEPLEEKAEELERFAEIKAAAERAERLEARSKLLADMNAAYNKDIIADMDEPMFQSFLEGLKKLEEARKAEAERLETERIRLEAERLEAERAAAEERERLRKELEAERVAAAAERKRIEEERAAERAKAEKERKEAEAAAATERKKREEIEQAERKRKEAEAEAERIKAEAERKAKSAPDREKLLKLAETLGATTMPEMTTEEGRKLLSEAQTLIGKIVNHINVKAEGI